MDNWNGNRRQFSKVAAAGVSGWAMMAHTAFGDTASSGGISAGAAEVIVTPPAVGTFIIGPLGPSTGINDELYARALVLSDGNQKLVIVTIDYLGFDFAYNDVLIGAISKRTGIPAENIVINASHNHSSPLTIPWGAWEKKKDKPWHATLPVHMADIVEKANNSLEPAKIKFRREPTQIGFNRRLPVDWGVTMAPNPHGTVVPWTDVLVIDNPEGKHIAVIYTYAAHPVIVHSASTLISADYPGFVAANLNKWSGGNGVFMFAQGCGGDINGFPLASGLGAAKAAGRDLSYAVGRAVRGTGHDIKVDTLGIKSNKLQLPLAAPPSVKRCKELVAGASGDEKERLQELLAIAEGGKPQKLDFPIRAFALGKQLCVVSLPHEMFSAYRHFIEEISPFEHTMVFAYTNGCEAYIGTEKSYKLGEASGYETSPMGAPLLYQPRLPIRPECEGLIQAGIKKTLEQLVTV